MKVYGCFNTLQLCCSELTCIFQADLRYQSHALCALQHAAEIYLVNLFEVNASNLRQRVAILTF